MMQVKEEVGLVLAPDLAGPTVEMYWEISRSNVASHWSQFAAYPETWTYALCPGSIEGGFSGSSSSDGALRGIIYRK